MKLRSEDAPPRGPNVEKDAGILMLVRSYFG